ncbi:MAG TPA: FtsX-like permease family protein [Anaerolineaceae bacterium]
MRSLGSVFAIFTIGIKRLVHQPWLAAATIFGLVIAIALTISVPLYANAIYNRIFLGELSGEKQAQSGDTRSSSHPPFSFLFRYFGSINGNLEWENIASITSYFSPGSLQSALNLPEKITVQYFATDPYQLFPGSTTRFNDPTQMLAWTPLGFMTDLEQHIIITDGKFPAPAQPVDTSTVEVLISQAFAEKFGLQVGENLILLIQQTSSSGKKTTISLPLQVSGVWIAKDTHDAYWFLNPEFVDNLLLVNDRTFIQRISPFMTGEIYTAFWYFLMDGSSVNYQQAASLVQKIRLFEVGANSLVPNVSLWVSPVEALTRYEQITRVFTILLFVFNIPVIGLILAFVSLTASLTIERQRNETAILRSRGAFVSQLLGIVLIESILLTGIAWVISHPIGAGIAWLVVQTTGFLQWSATNGPIQVSFPPVIFYFGIGAAATAILLRTLPALGAVSNTIVTYKQERARLLRPPLWQRTGLDLLLFLPAGYGTYLLMQQGRIAVFSETANNSPFENPLFFLVPSLMVLAITLLFLRLVPWFMRLTAWILAHTRSVGLLMAVRNLARMPGFYNVPLILLVLTLSLSTFTASLAKTLDDHLVDQVYYQVGADMAFLDSGEARSDPFSGSSSSNPAQSQGKADDDASYLFLPVSEYLTLPGVEAVTRIATYNAEARISGVSKKGVFKGIDRYSLPEVTFWRRDFAHESLGALMNALAATPEGVLLSSDFMAQNSLRVGDSILIAVNIYGHPANLQSKVVGSFNLFPGWYPNKGSLFIGNLDYLFEETGGLYPYDVLLKTVPEANYPEIVNSLRKMGSQLTYWKAAKPYIQLEKQQPERQGLFGMLTIGFIAAAGVTVLGFLLYAFFSFRRRFIELGVLRAIGLSIPQMTSILAWELIILVFLGGALGAGAGIAISRIYIPFLQIGANPTDLIPPYVVKFPWETIIQIYLLFSGLFLFALGILVAMLRRMKIFQAVKLGETV